jgi:hypothetical protein
MITGVSTMSTQTTAFDDMFDSLGWTDEELKEIESFPTPEDADFDPDLAELCMIARLARDIDAWNFEDQ